jgi:Uma2 family endonuclease
MSSTIESPPMLESGDRLSREEFHRRYCARPDIKKAELVSGVVYVPSPARVLHGEPHSSMNGWLHAYKSRTPGVRVSLETTVYLGDDTEVQPDIVMFFDPPRPGGARVREDHYIEGPPQLVVEIAVSSVSYDLHDKLEAYRRAGVLEYIAWRVNDRAIDWFRLQNGAYIRIEPDERGVIESAVFPGLRLAVQQMIAGDDAAVLAELRRDA